MTTYKIEKLVDAVQWTGDFKKFVLDSGIKYLDGDSEFPWYWPRRHIRFKAEVGEDGVETFLTVYMEWLQRPRQTMEIGEWIVLEKKPGNYLIKVFKEHQFRIVLDSWIEYDETKKRKPKKKKKVSWYGRK